MRLRQLREEDLSTVVAQASASFGRTLDERLRSTYRTRIAAGEVWGFEEDGTVLGHCRLLDAQHWLGGRRVPCLDIAAVAVPPENRGRGVASGMMRAAVSRGVAEGYGLSLLFPSTTKLYRRLGWDLAGSLTRYRVRARAVPSGGGPSLRVADRESDWDGIRGCQEAFAAQFSGPGVRGEARWEDLAQAPHRYVLDADEPGQVEAYVLVEHRPISGSWQHVLRVSDWAATTSRGLAALASFVGSHGTFARDVELLDSAPPRWAGLLPEQDLQTAGGLYWMARGLDLPTAIAHRGFPAGLVVTVTLSVADDLAPSGPWRLEVADQRGQLTQSPDAEVELEPSAVGPLVTGFRSASELARLGSLQGPAAAIAKLDSAFAGPPPVMFDFF